MVMIRCRYKQAVSFVVLVSGWHCRCHRDCRRSSESTRIGRRWLHRLRQSSEVELVGVSFAVNFCHDVLVVIVTKRPTHFVVIHVRFALALSPTTSHFVRISHFEFTRRTFPRNTWGITGVGQQFEQELPQLNLSAACLKNIWKYYEHNVFLLEYLGRNLSGKI